MTHPLERAISDALQPLTPEDFDDGDKIISAEQQCMWDLAFYRGKAAPILEDCDYLAANATRRWRGLWYKSSSGA